MLDLMIGIMFMFLGYYCKKRGAGRLTVPAMCIGFLFVVFSIFSLMTGQSILFSLIF